MAAAETKKALVSFEEYLQLEQDTDQRYEFYNGEVFAMAGESLRHNDIAGNIYTTIRASLRSKGCLVQIENIKVELESRNYYVYPDVVVSCHPEDLQEEYFIKHPGIVVEVLSPTTETYDRKVKLQRYGGIASLKYVLLVHQKSCLVEVFTKTDQPNGFRYDLYGDLQDVIEFTDPDVNLSLREIYEGIRFDPQPGE